MQASGRRLLRPLLWTGLIGGLVVVASSYVGFLLEPYVPLIGLVLLGSWLVPGLYAVQRLRRPGAGLGAGIIAGAVVGPFWPAFWPAIAYLALCGVCVEIPYLVCRYRRWSLGMALTSGAVGGLAIIGQGLAMWVPLKDLSPEVVATNAWPLLGGLVSAVVVFASVGRQTPDGGTGWRRRHAEEATAE